MTSESAFFFGGGVAGQESLVPRPPFPAQDKLPPSRCEIPHRLATSWPGEEGAGPGLRDSPEGMCVGEPEAPKGTFSSKGENSNSSKGGCVG